LPIAKRPTTRLPPIEWSHLSTDYRNRRWAGVAAQNGNRRPPEPRRRQAAQSLPAKPGQVRLLIADRTALAAELLARFRACAGH
jgi:hypothetical protein